MVSESNRFRHHDRSFSLNRVLVTWRGDQHSTGLVVAALAARSIMSRGLYSARGRPEFGSNRGRYGPSFFQEENDEDLFVHHRAQRRVGYRHRR